MGVPSGLKRVGKIVGDMFNRYQNPRIVRFCDILTFPINEKNAECKIQCSSRQKYKGYEFQHKNALVPFVNRLYIFKPAHSVLGSEECGMYYSLPEALTSIK